MQVLGRPFSCRPYSWYIHTSSVAWRVIYNEWSCRRTAGEKPSQHAALDGFVVAGISYHITSWYISSYEYFDIKILLPGKCSAMVPRYMV